MSPRYAFLIFRRAQRTPETGRGGVPRDHKSPEYLASIGADIPWKVLTDNAAKWDITDVSLRSHHRRHDTLYVRINHVTIHIQQSSYWVYDGTRIKGGGFILSKVYGPGIWWASICSQWITLLAKSRVAAAVFTERRARAVHEAKVIIG